LEEVFGNRSSSTDPFLHYYGIKEQEKVGKTQSKKEKRLRFSNTTFLFYLKASDHLSLEEKER